MGTGDIITPIGGKRALYCDIEVSKDIVDSDTGELLFRKGESIIKKFVVIR